jgi:hypothetical protein
MHPGDMPSNRYSTRVTRFLSLTVHLRLRCGCLGALYPSMTDTEPRSKVHLLRRISDQPQVSCE